MTMHGWTANNRLFVPNNGKIWWFKRTGSLNQSVKLTHIENLDGDDLPGGGFVYEDLPANVRKVLRDENVRFVPEKTTVAGAMS